ncbi:hypothetical protein SBRCBS47491_005950 [Sporothrix bragantina]|uniref:Alpha/beta hydrolase fold-3 domain-containing protein n=1 Tax=Sporothrix bragantina TaxID=671064 RepID=A0ABP0C1U0_9PEZI
MELQSDVVGLRAQSSSFEEKALAALGPCPEGIAEAWIDIELPAVANRDDAWTSRALAVYPTTPSSSPSSLVVMLHGGEFLSGSIKQLVMPARAYALRFGAVVVCPSYQLGPEKPFPAPVHTAYRAAAWISDVDNLYCAVPELQDAGIVVDPVHGSFVLYGIGVAGGNLAAVIAGVLAATPETQEVLLRNGGGLPRFRAPFTGLFVDSPLITTDESVPSKYMPLLRSRFGQNDTPPSPSTPSLHRILELYAPNVYSPWFSPLMLDDGYGGTELVTANHVRKVFIQAYSEDCLRDNAAIYRDWLASSGITDVRLSMVDAHGHGGWDTTTPKNHRKELKETSLEGMSWLLGKEYDESRDNADGLY